MVVLVVCNTSFSRMQPHVSHYIVASCYSYKFLIVFRILYWNFLFSRSKASDDNIDTIANFVLFVQN